MSDLPPRGPSSPSLESDFREIREERGLSLEELHQETRVPHDVLRRFESGQLLADDSFSDVYLKAFVKGYAKALGIPQSRADAAFQAHRAGLYDGQLREDYAPSSPPATPGPPPESGERAGEPAEAAPSGPPPSAPAVEALRTGGTAVPSQQAAPKVEAQRVTRPVVPAAKRSFDKNWGTLGGIAFVLIALVAAALWFLVFRDDSPDPGTTEVVESNEEGTTPDSASVQEGPVGPRLQTPISVTVSAEGDGLQWFRYSIDGEESFVWVDAGTSQTYTADSSLVLLGEGNQGGPAYDFDETTLQLQGLSWRPQNGSPVRITLRNGQALLDSLARAGVSDAAPEPAQPE